MVQPPWPHPCLRVAIDLDAGKHWSFVRYGHDLSRDRGMPGAPKSSNKSILWGSWESGSGLWGHETNMFFFRLFWRSQHVSQIWEFQNLLDFEIGKLQLCEAWIDAVLFEKGDAWSCRWSVMYFSALGTPVEMGHIYKYIISHNILYNKISSGVRSTVNNVAFRRTAHCAAQDFLKEHNQKELSMHEQMMLRQAEAPRDFFSVASELGAVYPRVFLNMGIVPGKHTKSY